MGMKIKEMLKNRRIVLWGLIGLAFAIVAVLTIIMMIPKSLADFFPWEDMEQKKIWVNYGRWEWSPSSNYASDSADYMEGTEGYERLKKLLETTKCSGFVQTLFPKNGYEITGAQASIMLDVSWEKDGEWQWGSIRVYENDIVIVDTGNGARIYYMDWFGMDGCERFFEEVKNVLKECESQEDAEEKAKE